ncbi:early boundary activity protein 1-like [Episyrphus balteatus]|uniref:early boundary activity protein 1-like n=1 Tax=Episyrphus balteatus TaxID=286459 RepID=UPI0024857C25|nr:early boundary activity protein 1-like [Episyrphus balteatus]
MATFLLHRKQPLNRKQRLLEYIKIQEKSKELEIEKEIEAVFEKLVSDPDGESKASKIGPKEVKTTTKREHQETNPNNSDSPPAKKPKLVELPTQQLKEYSEKFNSVVEQAEILHKQLQDVAEQGIIVCEDADVAYEDVKTVVEREHSPVPEMKMKQSDKKPIKKILHITGDSTLEYYEEETTDDFDLANEEKENSPIKEKKKKRRSSKKSTKEHVHITGDSPSLEDYEEEESSSGKSSPVSDISNQSQGSLDCYPRESAVNPEYMVIGPNETHISKYDFKNIDWNLSAPIVTRKLLLHIFGREILSTHSLTGKPSPAFLNVNKPLKKPLDANKVADIIYIVTNKMNVKPKEVRLAITSKCADEQKMRKTRLSK